MPSIEFTELKSNNYPDMSLVWDSDNYNFCKIQEVPKAMEK